MANKRNVAFKNAETFVDEIDVVFRTDHPLVVGLRTAFLERIPIKIEIAGVQCRAFVHGFNSIFPSCSKVDGIVKVSFTVTGGPDGA